MVKNAFESVVPRGPDAGTTAVPKTYAQSAVPGTSDTPCAAQSRCA